MRLHHIAFWTHNIEALVAFYSKHFSGRMLFSHQAGDFRCVFMDICSGTKLEIMSRPVLAEVHPGERIGYSHFSVEVGSKAEVDRLTEYFQRENVPLGKVREQYDDGFYESSVLDPDGNIIEIAYVDRTVNPFV